MRTRLGLLSTLLLLSAIGCYSYLPINVAPKVGERVRIALTPQGSVELARYLGPRVTMAEGALNSIASDGAYVVSVDWVQTADGVRQPWSGEGSVSVPLQYVAETRERTYQRRQTIVASTAISVGLVTVAIIALRAAGVGGNGGGNPPPPPP